MSFHIFLLVFQLRDGIIALGNDCGETSNKATDVWYSFSVEYANSKIAFCKQQSTAHLAVAPTQRARRMHGVHGENAEHSPLISRCILCVFSADSV